MSNNQLTNSLINQLTHNNEHRASSIDKPSSVLSHPFSVLAALHLSRKLYKSTLFMQNEPNFKNAQIYISPCNTNSYGNLIAVSHPKNEPKQTQNKPNSNPVFAFTTAPKPAKFALLTKNSVIQKTSGFPIYKFMEIELKRRLKTKLCPFCAEVIQQQALKCRFCGEILSPDRIKAVEKTMTPAETGDNERVLYAARPSLWAMSGTCVKAFVVLAFAYFLVKYPLENLPIFAEVKAESPVPAPNYSNYEAEDAQTAKRLTKPFYVIELTANQIAAISKYRIIFGTGLFIFVPLVLFYKALKLKMMHYEVTPQRIEFSRGIFDRKVDNIDMFRVVDLKMRRSLLDCIVGVGTVGLITTDKTDPIFNFEKVHRARLLYDIIKMASLEADRTTNVIHME